MSEDAADRTDVAHHDWRVETREYRRQESRRGRRHAYEALDPSRTALLVIDVVPFFVDESPYVRGIIAPINTLAAELRRAGGVVAWVVPGYRAPSTRDREFLGAEIAEMFARCGGEGAPRDRLSRALEPADHDLFVEKTTHSAYNPAACPLPDLLEQRGIDTVVVTGTVTNVCVESTVRDANTQGLRVILVADACAAMRDQDHNATLHVVYRTFGDVRPTADVLDMLRA